MVDNQSDSADGIIKGVSNKNSPSSSNIDDHSSSGSLFPSIFSFLSPHHQSSNSSHGQSPNDQSELGPSSFPFVRNSDPAISKPSGLPPRPLEQRPSTTVAVSHLLASVKKRKTRKANAPGSAAAPHTMQYSDVASETASVKSSRPACSEPDLQTPLPCDSAGYELNKIINHSKAESLELDSYDDDVTPINDDPSNLSDHQKTPPPPPPPLESHLTTTEFQLTSPPDVKSAWDVSEKLMSEFLRLQKEEEEIVLSEKELLMNRASIPVTTRRLKAKIDELKELQDLRIEEENYSEAELLDEEIKKLKAELATLKSTSTSPFEHFLEVQTQLMDRTAEKIKVLDRCFEEFQIARTSVLEEAKKHAAFESSRGSSDIERLKFESERLHLDLSQIVNQFSSVESELGQVEERIDQLTLADQTERQEALKIREVVDSEIEQLQQLLSSKLNEQKELNQKIGACDIRIATARAKFQKQLTRLQTSKASLDAARREVIIERRQLQQLKCSIWSARQEAEGRLDRLLCEVCGVSVVVEELKRRVQIPLMLTLEQRQSLFVQTKNSELNVDDNSDENLRRTLCNLETLRRDIDRCNQSIIQTRAEKLALQQQMAACHSQKVGAIASRAFKDAGRLAAQIKELEERDQEIDRDIADLSALVEQFSVSFKEKEEEERKNQIDVENKNRSRTRVMVRIIDNYRRELKKCLRTLDKYRKSINAWIAYISREAHSYPDLNSWTKLTALFIERLNGFDDATPVPLEPDETTEIETHPLLDHPIGDRLRKFATMLEETSFPILEEEDVRSETYVTQWKEDFGLEDVDQENIESENIGSENIGSKNIESTDADGKWWDKISHIDFGKFKIDDDLKDCQKFLDDTRDLLNNEATDGDGSELDVLFAKMERKKSRELSDSQDISKHDINGIFDSTDDLKNIGERVLDERDSKAGDESCLSSSTPDPSLTSPKIASTDNIEELIVKLEAELEDAVASEDYDMAASLNEQIELLRSKLE